MSQGKPFRWNTNELKFLISFGKKTLISRHLRTEQINTIGFTLGRRNWEEGKGDPKGNF